MANDAIQLNLEALASVPAITPIGSDKPVSETLPLAVRKIAEALHPHQIILFGSYAYGTPTPDSDVDLLVVLEMTEARQASRTWPASRLLLPRPFAMDILVKTPKEMSTAQKKGDFFIAEIMRQGKVLYERPR